MQSVRFVVFGAPKSSPKTNRSPPAPTTAPSSGSSGPLRLARASAAVVTFPTYTAGCGAGPVSGSYINGASGKPDSAASSACSSRAAAISTQFARACGHNVGEEMSQQVVSATEWLHGKGRANACAVAVVSHERTGRTIVVPPSLIGTIAGPDTYTAAELSSSTAWATTAAPALTAELGCTIA